MASHHRFCIPLAIEATKASFSRLCENMKLNNERFAVVQRAVYSRSGIDVEFITHPRRHAGNSCVDARGKPGDIAYQREVVRSITIDDILSTVFVNKAGVKEYDALFSSISRALRLHEFSVCAASDRTDLC
jgi:FkbM family methyltransferase